MIKQAKRAGAGLGPVLAVGLAVLVSGCNLEVFNPGAITDDALNDATLMDVVANGVANEFNQIPDNFALDVLRLSDEAAGNGSYFQTGRLRRGALDWTEDSNFYAQIHETIWTGQAAWYRMSSLADYDQNTSADAARVWLLIGLAHRFYGELFCDVVYSRGADFTVIEKHGVQNRTAAFDSAIASLNRAITIGNAAGSSAADIVTAAEGGLAQAYMGKGDFATAIMHTVNVPTAFVRSAIYNLSSNQNLIYDETNDRNEVGLFNAYASNLDLGGANAQDPRVQYEKCGTFDDPTDPFNSNVTATGTCSSENGADGVTAHWRQTKYNDDGADIPVVTGVEMRLIEAEAALLANDLATFTARINDVRTFYGLTAIAQPATAGALEYTNSPTSPFQRVLHNAYDAGTGNVTDPGVDGWSILDGERHLTTWGEARRLWDLHRWQHPFLDGGIVFWDTEPRRVSCYPVPEDECTLNEELLGATLLTGIGTGTQTCN